MSSEIKFAVGQNIKKLRKKLKFTQEQLASAADIDYKYLQRIEGKNPPDIGIELVQKVAIALKTSPSKLLSVA
jgi:transcriptional regulator with XRE-family HTH domain